MQTIHLFTQCLFFLTFCFYCSEINGKIQLGVENLFSPTYQSVLRGKKIGLITNHTAIDSKGTSIIDLFKQNGQIYGYSITAFFAPEHGLTGLKYAGEKVDDERDADGIRIYSLHGSTRRPTPAMLKDVTLLIYDIQDIGSRSYTYISTLFYAMEEAAKANIPFLVLDRPNPLGGELVDGPMLEEKRSGALLSVISMFPIAMV